MSGEFAINGLASGLPSDIVDQLMSTKQTRLKAYENDKSFFSSQKSAFAELKTKLTAFSSVASTLQDASSWSPHTATSSNTDKMEVSADSDAVAGSHQVEVSRLASSNVWMSSGGVTDSADTINTLTNFQFDYNGQTYNAATLGIAAGQTLASVVDKINSYDYKTAAGVSEAGISAGVLYDGTNYRLTMTAKDAGAYVRAGDGSTTNSRLENLNVNLDWATSGNTWNTGAVTGSSGTTTASTLTDATATISSTIDAAAFSFTYNAVTYNLDGVGGTQLQKDGAALVAGTSTLSDLAEAITQTAGAAGVTASVVNDGVYNSLVLDGSTAGQSFSAITAALTFTGTTGTVTTGTSSGFFQSSRGQDAKLIVDGLSNIYSSSNVVSEVLPGVSLTVKETTAASTPVTVTVSNDTAKIKETLNSFVSSYNDIVTNINGKKATSFSGSTLARSIISQMRSELNTPTSADDLSGDNLSPYSMLAEMGLRTDQKTGLISFNSSTLDDALTNSFTSLTKIFTNTQTAVGTGNNAGLAHRMETLMDGITSSSSGSLTGRTDGLQARIDSLEKSIERENSRLEKVRERLVSKFSNLEQLVNSMNSAGSALTSALSGLSK